MTNQNYDAELANVKFNLSYLNGKLMIAGNCFNDTKGRFNNGEWITTTNIQNIEYDIIQTKNTRYKILNFNEDSISSSDDIKSWIEENSIDIDTDEGLFAFTLRWL